MVSKSNTTMVQYNFILLSMLNKNEQIAAMETRLLQLQDSELSLKTPALSLLALFAHGSLLPSLPSSSTTSCLIWSTFPLVLLSQFPPLMEPVL